LASTHGTLDAPEVTSVTGIRRLSCEMGRQVSKVSAQTVDWTRTEFDALQSSSIPCTGSLGSAQPV